MANKKIFMSVSATAVIASAFMAAGTVEAASYKVKNGDSLWNIAQTHSTSVSSLISLNNLSSDLIFPNQVLETEKKKSTKPASNSGSANSSSGSSSASKDETYTVQRGDTLSGIAAKYSISLTNLMKWNNLDTTLIFPGNHFIVRKGASGSSGSNGSGGSSGSSTTSPPKQEVGSTSVYTVKSGDTLSHIAKSEGVRVASLKKWNSLSSDLILIGQKLSIGEASGNKKQGKDKDKVKNEQPSADVSYNVKTLINTAKGLTGIGYVWGGQTVNGFDCSGFIHYAYNKAGRSGARYSTAGYYDRSFYVDNPQVGDLVFFENTYKSGISHMGIYLGNNEFVHAGSSGVTVSNLNNSYWKSHYDGFKRFY